MNRFVLLLCTLFVLILPTACSDEMLGGWDEMKWNMQFQDGGGDPMDWSSEIALKDGAIEVPADGGTYVLKCKNYSSIWLSNVKVNGEYVEFQNNENRSLQGEWFKISIDQEVMTVSIDPNPEQLERTLSLTVTVGDVFDAFRFE